MKKMLVLLIAVGVFAQVCIAAEDSVNWAQNVIVSKGMGVASNTLSNEAQAKLLARRAAIIDGYRGIAEAVEGIQIDSKTTVKDLVVQNDSIDAKVSSFIKGAQIKNEDFRDGAYTVEMSAPINGDGSLAGIVGKTLTADVGQAAEEAQQEALDNGIDFEENVIVASGHGLPPQNAQNDAQAKQMARRAAVIEAQRNLVEFIYGVQIDSKTTVENLITSSDVINTSVSGIIKGAKIVSEKQNKDNSCEIVMSIPISGAGSLSESLGKDLIWDYDFSELSDKAPTIEKLTNGEIDWEDGIVVASGFGVKQKDSSGSQAWMLARRAAIVDAQRNLAEIVNGVTVSGQTTVKDMVLANDTAASELNASLSNFKIIKEQEMNDGTYKVALALKIEGVGNLEDIIVDENVPGATAPGDIEYGITGVIIDASGLGIKPAMAPMIYDENGMEVYGSFKNLDSKYAVKNGIADYVASQSGVEASGRAGDNPLTAKALKAGTSKNRCDIVISNDDAKKIRDENEKSGFLKGLRVVIIL